MEKDIKKSRTNNSDKRKDNSIFKRYGNKRLPKHRLPVAGETLPDTSYQENVPSKG